MPLSQKNASIDKKLLFPVVVFLINLLIISITVTYFVSGFRDRDHLIFDLTEQRNILSNLEASLARISEGLTQYLYLNNEEVAGVILAETEDLQFRLIKFKDISTKHDLINELSLADEVEPIFEELRQYSYDIISLKREKKSPEAKNIFEKNYLIDSRQIKRFSAEVLYGKIEKANELLIENANARMLFFVVFILEIIVTFFITFLAHRRIACQLTIADKQLHELAMYDSLTGLYNRHMLIEHIQHLIAQADRQVHFFSLYYIDLDDFKKINDTWGHKVGDQLLQQIATRIRDLIRKSDILARIGSDEFILVADEFEGCESPAVLATRIMQLFESEFKIQKSIVKLNCSMGISDFPGSGKNAEELIQRADTAMYKAKAAGRNAFKFYSSSMTETASKQLVMENDLRLAIKNDEFSIYYQPKIDPRTGNISGAEALLRWIHPEKGFISPAEFIPIAEKSDLIIEIGKWVREKVLFQLSSWKKISLPLYKISINVSGKEFVRRVVQPHLIELFNRYGVNPQLLELEITEHTIMESKGDLSDIYGIIQNLGVSIAVDDFGTGYSSLGYLKTHSINTLKIDKSFIDNITEAESDASIVKAIVAMAHSLNLSVVAEGVESAKQNDFLLDINCDEIQGYYYSRPLPVEEYEKFVLSFDQKKVES